MRTSSSMSLTLLVLSSCAGTPPPAPPPVVEVAVSAPIGVPSAVVAVAETAAPAPSAPARPPADEGPRHKVALALHPGDPPCTVVFDAEVFSEEPGMFVAGSVARIATETSGGCAAGVLYDLTREKKARPGDEDPSPLAGGPFHKPGLPRPVPSDFDDWNRVEDLDFDGYADLCAVVMTGSYNYSQRCWRFDPQKRVFVREKDLDPLIFAEVDAAKKTLSSRFRAVGSTYGSMRYAWEKGRLVTTLEEYETLGTRADGKPLPAGYDRWVVRKERRGGRLVKVFEGPDKTPP